MGVDIQLTGVPDFDKLEIVKTGKVTTTFGVSGVHQLIHPHNLGYRPLLLIYWVNEDDTFYTPLPIAPAQTVDTGANRVYFLQWAYAEVDDTNIYISLANSLSVGPTMSFRYYLLRQSAK